VDNQHDTTNKDAINGTAQLPFHAFYSLLSSNGFSVTAQQVIDANKIIINYSNRIKNEAELCLYLLPIFTANEDEQVLFKQLFQKHFRPKFITEGHIETKKEIFLKRLKRNWKKILISYGLVALILVALIIIIFKELTRPETSKITVTLVNTRMPAKTGSVTNSFSVTPKQALTVKTVCRYNQKKDPFGFTMITRFNWGDHSLADSTGTHQYKAQGKYDLTAYVEVVYKNKTLKYDTIKKLVLVCAEKNALQIDYGGKTNISINQRVVLKATVDNTDKPDYIKWSSAGKDLLFGDTYTLSFFKPGSYSVSCLAVYDSVNSPCSIQQDISFFVVDPKEKKVDQQPAKDVPDDIPDPEETVAEKKASPALFYLYLLLAIVFGILAILFLILSERDKTKTGTLKREVFEKYTKLMDACKGRKTPGIIPFKNKNYLPVHQTEINYAARLMRKRVSDNSHFLHIPKTITKSIENNGLLQPVMAPRTRQTEYLVLIDETCSNSQLVKLYEYLAFELKKQNILIERYYYRHEPKLCYRYNEPGSITLEKLFTRYENHMLLIFGDASQLIYTFYPVFDKDYLAILNRWQYKAVLTPVSFPDWGTKEKSILLPHIPVFPMDIEGILLLAEYLADNTHHHDIISRLNQHKSLFYKADGLDFERIEDLAKYCTYATWALQKEMDLPVNILFQWIAALAVYPKISWEVTIALGKTILDKYNCVHELNYTNLLRIARISWMKAGTFPDAIRLELLKQLTTENEKLARQTMLHLLKEIPATEIAESSLAYEEKEIQQIIHEFSLYANDPVYYKAYKQSRDIYEQLWKEKKLKDAVAKLYFKNPDNSWKTMIHTESRDEMIVHVGIEEYFEKEEKEETTLSKLYMWLCLISLFVCIVSLFALRILWQWENYTDV
jgi:hypothetical protein